VAGGTPQVSFFALYAGGKKETSQANGRSRTGSEEAGGRSEKLPTQRQIPLARDFSPKELKKLTTELVLGSAATARHIKELNSGSSRGIDQTDSRPLDWARSDLKQYQFLTDQVRQARRGKGYIDTSSLKKGQLKELWQFSQFEAERALRNIDHLQAGLSHLKGPTADHLVEGHKLRARFYGFLANQLGAAVSEEEKARERW
jgi:hypothetical protein